jgi:hypothetical protein
LPCPASSWPSQLDTAYRQEPTEALAAKVRLTEKLTKLKEEMGKLDVCEKQMLASLDRQVSLTDPDSHSMERPRLRRRLLQRAGRRRYRAPSDRDARDDEQRLRSAQLANMAKQAKAPERDARGRGRSQLLQQPESPRLPQGRYHRDLPKPLTSGVKLEVACTCRCRCAGACWVASICAIEDTLKLKAGETILIQ